MNFIKNGQKNGHPFCKAHYGGQNGGVILPPQIWGQSATAISAVREVKLVIKCMQPCCRCDFLKIASSTSLASRILTFQAFQCLYESLPQAGGGPGAPGTSLG